MAKNNTKLLSQTIFTTQKILEINELMSNGFIIPRKDNPWLDGKEIGVRRKDVVFQKTPFEHEEYLKCALGEAEDGLPFIDSKTQKLKNEGIEYFANNYGNIKLEDGSYGLMKIRDYQYDILDLYNNNRFSILMASRQSGKCLFYQNYLEISPNKYVPIYKIWFFTKKNKSFIDYLKYCIYSILYTLDK